MELNENLKKIKKFLKQQKDVLFSYFYGSRAEGVPRGSSDLDIAIYLDSHLKSMYDLFYQEMLERLKGGRFGVRPEVIK